MTDIAFYHLQRQPLERALPMILGKCLERGWRVVVQAADEARVGALDDALWTYDDASFLPHGTVRDGEPEGQPVLLTADEANPNAAVVRVLVDGAEADDLNGYERVMVMFDGADPDAVATARAQWSTLKAAGHVLTYWQQDEAGRWQKRA